MRNLGRQLDIPQPEADGKEHDGSEVVVCALVVAGCDASGVLELSQGPFD